VTALVLLPAYTPPLPDTAHLTLVWAGEQADSSTLAALGVIGSQFSRTQLAFPAKVMGTALFGEKRNEPVLLTELTMQIALMRAAVQQYSKSEYDEFRPHVAIPGLTPKILNPKTRPQHLYFNALALWPTSNYAENEVRWWLGG
jgi:2'-5' RNA ligase